MPRSESAATVAALTDCDAKKTEGVFWRFRGLSLFCHGADFLVTYVLRSSAGHSKVKCSSSPLQAAGAARRVVEHETYQGLAVVDLIGSDQSQRFRDGETEDLDVFVRLGGGCAFADVAGKINLHPLAEETRAGEVLCQQRPTFGAVAGLLDQLALGSSKGCFVRFNSAGGEFDESAASGVTVLALEDDLRIVGVRRLVDGQDDDGAVMADHVASVNVAAGLLDLVGDDGEDLAFVGELGRNEARFAGLSFLVSW
jgi:hypothetical protein